MPAAERFDHGFTEPGVLPGNQGLAANPPAPAPWDLFVPSGGGGTPAPEPPPFDWSPYFVSPSADPEQGPFDWHSYFVNPYDTPADWERYYVDAQQPQSDGGAPAGQDDPWAKYFKTIQQGVLGYGASQNGGSPQLNFAPAFSNLGYGASQNTGPVVGYVGGSYGIYPSLAAYSAANSAAMWAGSGSGIGGIGSGTYGNVGGANQGMAPGGGGMVTGYASLGGDVTTQGRGEGPGGTTEEGGSRLFHYGVRAPGPTGHQGHLAGKVT